MSDPLFETAAVYKLLSVMLSYPTEEAVSAVRACVGVDADLEELRRQYHAIFGGPLPGLMPPMEAEYDQPHVFAKAQTLADLAGFYRAFGLEPVGGLHRVDHIAIEFEFAHILAAKEGVAASRRETENAEVCRDARRKMLAEHLGAWGVPFLRLVSRQAVGGAYARVASFARDFLLDECRELGVEAKGRTPQQNEPQRPEGIQGCPPDT